MVWSFTWTNKVFSVLIPLAKCPIKKSTFGIECKMPFKTYDYFSGNEISFVLSFLLVGLLPFSKWHYFYITLKVLICCQQELLKIGFLFITMFSHFYKSYQLVTMSCVFALELKSLFFATQSYNRKKNNLK
jgi:hypothetical protein